MKSIAFVFVTVGVMTACSSDYEEEFTNETFELGESLVYEMPILESDTLQPTSQDASTENHTKLLNTYWLTDQDHYINTVDVAYQLNDYGEDYMPFFVYPLDERLVADVDSISLSESLEMDGQEWFHIEYIPYEYEHEEENMVSVVHEYFTRSGFELYTYIFTLSASKEAYESGEKDQATEEKMKEILQLTQFTEVETMTQEEVHERLNGDWMSEETGLIQFSDDTSHWYQGETVQEQNMITIEFEQIDSLPHPLNHTEYAYLEGAVIFEKIEGESHESNIPMRFLVKFLNDTELTMIELDSGILYHLSKMN